MSARERLAHLKQGLSDIDRRVADNPRARERLGIAVAATFTHGALALIFAYMPAPDEVRDNTTTLESQGTQSSTVVYSPSSPNLITMTPLTQRKASRPMPPPPSEFIPGEKLKVREEDPAVAQNYIETAILPLLAEAGLTVIKPVNEDVEEVNLPNQFIVSEDGIYGSQITVSSVDGGVKQVSATVSGRVSLLRDGKVYGKAVTTGDLCHGELREVVGFSFPPTAEGAQEAVEYIAQVNRTACQETTWDNQGSEITSTPS